MRLLGVLVIGCSIVGGIAFWLYTLINWCIFPIITAATSSPIDGMMLGWGIAWFFLSKIIGGLIIGVGSIIGGLIGE